MAVDVEQHEALKRRRISAVDEETGSDPRLKVTGSEIAPVEVKQPLRRAMPGEAVGEAVHEAIVDCEHHRRVDCMRPADRGRIGRPPIFICVRLGHAARI